MSALETAVGFTADEMMTVEAARRLSTRRSVFVGIGLPSTAANLARALDAPDLILVYESGCLGSKPTALPLSIGDGILAETADVVVSVPEVFNYWLQPQRIDIGFLAAAQIDRYCNINTTVIGDYVSPTVRLPGAGGAPEIAASCKEVIVIVRQSPRAFVERVDFVTSFGYGTGHDDREKLGLVTAGPRTVITDIGVMASDPVSKELTLIALHPGRTAEEAVNATGWELRVASDLFMVTPPSARELDALRTLQAASLS